MKQVREKTEAGFNRISELYNSESRLALSKGNYISRQQDLNQALVTFHRQFGRMLDPRQFVLPEPTYEVPDTLPDTVNVAFNKHPALKVTHYNIEKSRSTYDKSSAAYYPSLDLELQGQYRSDTGGEEGDTTQTGAYLTLSYLFFDGGVRAGETGRDYQNIRKEHQRAYVERRNVNETVRLAWNIMDAEETKKQFLREHVTMSAKTLNAFKDEYFAGRRTLLDLLNMENEYTDSQLSMATSEFSHLTALYQIMQATGVLLEEHDTGIREMLQLPLEDSIDPADYDDELKDNRDQDELADLYDQCDNSLPGSIAEHYGCKNGEPIKTHYPHNNQGDFKPYIAPQDYDGTQQGAN
ncbi:MAG: TolC family protein [Desulfobulbaceae bacterium]|nr:TolC family protein [Desulfobulbaceae bacterium]